MKRVLEIILAIKSSAAMAFTGCIMLYVVVGMFFGLSALTFGLVWQFLAVSLICAGLQFIFFAEQVIKKMHYAWRSALFFVCFYVLLAAFAIGFAWFPFKISSFLVFTLIYFAIFFILLGVFEAYFHIAGIRYNQQLDAYKESVHE
jgi:hypothetical protein